MKMMMTCFCYFEMAQAAMGGSRSVDKSFRLPSNATDGIKYGKKVYLR